MDDRLRRGEDDIARRGARISLTSAQRRETPPEVYCCYSGFDGNLPPSKVFFLGSNIPCCWTSADHTNVPCRHACNAAMSL
jgi:hypothetical protein